MIFWLLRTPLDWKMWLVLALEGGMSAKNVLIANFALNCILNKGKHDGYKKLHMYIIYFFCCFLPAPSLSKYHGQGWVTI